MQKIIAPALSCLTRLTAIAQLGYTDCALAERWEDCFEKETHSFSSQSPVGQGSLGLLRSTFAFGAFRPVGAGGTFRLGLEGCSLGLASGGFLELRIASQVLQGAAGVEDDTHCLDVLGAEVFLVLNAYGADGGSEGTDVAELDLVALKDEFAHAHAQFREHAHDGAFGVDGIVLGDVLRQFGERDDASELEVGISLLGFLGVHGVGHHGHAVLNFFQVFQALCLLCPS